MTDRMVTLSIDGRKAEAREGETLLAVCRRLGKRIPTLCHHEAIEPYAACRVCLVEVTAGGRTTLVPSCQYPVAADVAVRTDSEAVVEGRRTVLELLLARCPGSETIRELAARYGVTETPYASDDPDETCILCGLCVRACEELIGESAIGFSQRGIERRVGAPLGESSAACIGCGACVTVCPTGHVRRVIDAEAVHMATWQTDLAWATCASCGQPFAPARLVERAAKDAPEELAEVARQCPRCRAKRTAQTWLQATKTEAGIGAGGR